KNQCLSRHTFSLSLIKKYTHTHTHTHTHTCIHTHTHTHTHSHTYIHTYIPTYKHAHTHTHTHTHIYIHKPLFPLSILMQLTCRRRVMTLLWILIGFLEKWLQLTLSYLYILVRSFPSFACLCL